MIALPPPPSKVKQQDNVVIQEEAKDKEGSNKEYDQFNIRHDNFHFQDEVKVGDKTLFTIDHEHIYQDESEKPKRKTKFGEKPNRKRILLQSSTFDPFDFLKNGTQKALLAQDQNDKTRYQQPEPQKRQSRWGPSHEKTFHPPLLQNIPEQLNQDDLEYLLRCYRLDEMANQQQFQQDTILDDIDCRSPSPPPEYDNQGRRVNTKDFLAKEAYKKERNDLIEECMKIKSSFVPPRDYRPPKKQIKIFLPKPEYGQENKYMGKIIGAGGTTQKLLEKESGCKIAIRGKGSSLNKRQDTSNEELHVLLQADTDEQIEKGRELVMQKLGEETSDFARSNALAVVQDYLVSDVCSNCHETGHKASFCPHGQRKVMVKCEICGDRSHVAIDCPQREQWIKKQQIEEAREKMGNNSDQFYEFLKQTEGEQNADELMKMQELMPPPVSKRERPSETQFITDEVSDSYIRSITATEEQTSLFQEDPYKKQKREFLPPPPQDPKIPQATPGQTYDAHQTIVMPSAVPPTYNRKPRRDDRQ